MSAQPKAELDALMAFRADFPSYARVALKIRTKSGAILPFVMNRAQHHTHRLIEDQRRRTGKVRALVLKGRQQGMSTYIEGRYYHRTSGDFGIRAFILTHEDQATQNLFAMADRYHEHCPPELKPHTGAANAKELVFDVLDSGYKVATAGTKNTGRSATAQLFHGSEVAFWPNANDHMAGIGQTIPNEPGTEIILESTANGPNGLFYEMWQDAERGRSEYIPIFVPWFWQPEYSLAPPADLELSAEDLDYQAAYKLTLGQMAWRQMKTRDDFRGDSALFDQEYPATAALAFRRIAGQVLIKASKVGLAMLPKPTVIPRGAKIMGLDPAEYGDDDSALIRRRGRKAWGLKRWHGLDPMDLVGRVAIEVKKWEAEDGVKVSALVVDCTGVGSGVASRLKELGYPVVRFMAGAGAIDEETYVRHGDEAWGLMREWIEDSEPCVIDGGDDATILQSDLISRTFEYDSARRIKLTSKEKLKAKGLKSPDCGDALSMTFCTYHADDAPSEAPGSHRNRRSRGKVI